MPRLIDADALIAEISPPEDAPNDGAKLILSVFIEAVKSFPAVDAAEVKHATWVEKPHKMTGNMPCCSSCGWFIAIETPYCPGCGAKMDGENNNNGTQS